ncbi:MAG: MarR family transcriptional regulator [Candidatus Pacebacteria bacterium]|nr:MarR family transcriptional regulator [Candidatus Paceibacterota bacterium]
MEKIQTLAKRESDSSMKVLRFLFTNPIVTTKSIMSKTGFSRPGAQKVIDRFIKLNILERYNEKETYDRKYIYKEYFDTFVD